MEVSYRKDLRHNYLVIPECEGSDGEAYSIRMLQVNSVSGIIKPDQRIIDNQVLFYYDITSRQSLQIAYEKAPISYEQLKSMFLSLADIIDQIYEYLLNENDLLLEPEYIFTELSTGRLYICYLPGYNRDLRKQIVSLIEYMMNKVDYKDKEAVLYIYNLYLKSRDEDFSYSSILSAIKEEKQDNPIKKEMDKTMERIKSRENNNKIKLPEAVIDDHIDSKNNIKQIPVMMEKISDDQEQYYYPLKTYIYTGLCGLGAVSVLFISIKTKLIYTSLGSRIDYSKLLVLLLMLLSVTAYLIKKIWDKKNRLTKIISKTEYYYPEYEDVFHKEKDVIHINSANEPVLNRMSGQKQDLLKRFRNNSYFHNKHGQISDLQKESDKEPEIDKNFWQNCSLDTGSEQSKSDIENLSIRDCHINYDIDFSAKDLHKGQHKEITAQHNEEYVQDNNINPTVILNADVSSYLCYLKPEEKDIYDDIKINSFPFIIGKQKGFVDYCLDKETVSRYHVKITKEEDGYYITDLNSTNGTCVNNNPLSCYQRTELKDKDQVTIAGIKYTFHVS